MANRTFFITGTDTEVGKTAVTGGLLRATQKQHYRSLGLKPVAAGCDCIDGQWRNQDAILLQENSTIHLPYETVNPIALRAAVAPHIAAQQDKISLSAQPLADHCKKVIQQHQDDVDFIFIEGAGGWLVPLNDEETFANLVSALNIPVVLVVGIKLGCINHALLTAKAVLQSGLTLYGWVANCIDPEASAVTENIHYLRQNISAPCLGVVPFLDDATSTTIAPHLNIDLLTDES